MYGELDCRYIIPEEPTKAYFHYDKEVKEPIYPQFTSKQDRNTVNAKKVRPLSVISTDTYFVCRSWLVRVY